MKARIVIDNGISVERTKAGTQVIVLRKLLKRALKPRRDGSVQFVVAGHTARRLARFIEMLNQ